MLKRLRFLPGTEPPSFSWKYTFDLFLGRPRGGDFHKFDVLRKKWTKSTSSELTRMHSLGFYEGVGGCRRAVYSSTFNQFPPRVNASVPLAWLQVSCVISTPFSGLSVLCFLNGVRRKILTRTQPVPSLFSIQMDWLDQWECREISFSSSVSSSASVASCRANQCRS